MATPHQPYESLRERARRVLMDNPPPPPRLPSEAKGETVEQASPASMPRMIVEQGPALPIGAAPLPVLSPDGQPEATWEATPAPQPILANLGGPQAAQGLLQMPQGGPQPTLANLGGPQAAQGLPQMPQGGPQPTLANLGRSQLAQGLPQMPQGGPQPTFASQAGPQPMPADPGMTARRPQPGLVDLPPETAGAQGVPPVGSLLEEETADVTELMILVQERLRAIRTVQDLLPKQMCSSQRVRELSQTLASTAGDSVYYRAILDRLREAHEDWLGLEEQLWAADHVVRSTQWLVELLSEPTRRPGAAKGTSGNS